MSTTSWKMVAICLRIVERIVIIVRIVSSAWMPTNTDLFLLAKQAKSHWSWSTIPIGPFPSNLQPKAMAIAGNSRNQPIQHGSEHVVVLCFLTLRSPQNLNHSSDLMKAMALLFEPFNVGTICMLLLLISIVGAPKSPKVTLLDPETKAQTSCFFQSTRAKQQRYQSIRFYLMPKMACHTCQKIITNHHLRI